MKFFKKNYFLIFIILLAAFLRLYRIYDYAEFLGDQGRDVIIVRNFLKHGELFFIGPQTSIGNMYLGPFYYYLIAPSLLLSNFNPVGPAIFIALLGVATAFLIYFVANKWFSKPVAIISSLLYAISPVAIKYSSFSWNPNIMPFFALLFIYFIFNSLYDRKYKSLLFASFSFILAINSHFLALILLPLAGLFWFIHLYFLIKNQDKKLPEFIKYSIWAVILFIVSLTPLILFDIKHHGQNVGAFIKFFSERQTTVNIKPYKSIPLLAPLFNQINTSLIAGKNITFGIIASIILALGILFTFLINKKNKSNKYFIVCALWYLLGLIGLGLYKQHIYDHYFGFIFPVVFILTGYVIYTLSLIPKLGKLIGLSLVISFVYFSLKENPFRYSANKQIGNTEQIVNFINSKTNNQPFNLALIAKSNTDAAYRYFFYQDNSPITDLHTKITDQLFVICEPWQVSCQPINNPLWEIAAFGWSKVDQEWDINGLKIFKLIANKSGQKQN